MKNFFAITSLLILMTGCNGTKEGAFQSMEGSTNDGGNTNLDQVSISSFTPTLDPIVLTGSTSMVFGVTVPGNVGSMTYEYKKDDSVVVQSGPNPFLTLNGNTLSSGVHTLKVTAINAISEDQKVFNLRKNNPTSIVSFTPALNGANLNCGTGSLTFSGIMNDLDNDAFSATWELDSQPVTPATPFATVTTVTPFSQLEYAPDCSKAGSHTLSLKIYDGYEVTTKTWNFVVNNPPAPPGAVQILSFTPTTNPVVITSTSSTTFAVTVADGSGAVNYSFIQDNSITLQTGPSSFYALSGSALTPGYHSLKIRAANSSSSDEKVFNLRKNTPPGILSFTPALTGNNVNCSGGSITINTTLSDVDNDAVSASWKLDDVAVSGSTPFVSTSSTATTAQLTYTPDCTKAGYHSVDLVLTDGYETFTQKWNISVNNPPTPPGNVQIVTFTPTNDPIVLTGTTNATFAVSILDGAGVVNYEFKQDYSTVVQNGTTPFYVLNGSSLTPGLHTLKVKGSNSVSYDEKVFNVRKNSASVVASYSPALAGSVMNCGQDTLTFNSIITDSDNDNFSMQWVLDSTPVISSTPFTSVISNVNSTQLSYSPDCTKSGYHTLVLNINDGYETTTKTWTFNVINPAVETITGYYPFSNNIVGLTTESTKTFTATGSGIGALTFKWYVDSVLVQSTTNSSSSSFNLDLNMVTPTPMVTGNHTIKLVLTDSTTSNDPSTPVTQSWTVYKNEKPRFVSMTPNAAIKVNMGMPKIIGANIEDALDTFSVSISKGSLDCVPASECGLSSITYPTSTGTFSSTFTPSSLFLGDNTFTLTVRDSHGESISENINIGINYFSSDCNNLARGSICTLIGLPGLGSGLNAITDANKLRLNPAWLTQDHQGNWFFSDHSTHTVWYYNTKSTAVTLWASTSPATVVPANSVYLVAGTGVAGSNGTGVAQNTPMNFGSWGGGLAWDSGRKELYIGDYGNNRVLRIGQNGNSSVVCGNSNSNVQGATASNHQCTSPVDIEFDSANRRLYVAPQAQHIIKYFDVSDASSANWKGYILAGINGTASNVSGTINVTGFPNSTASGTTTMNQPWGLHLDTTDNILYFTEYGSCRIRALGLPGATTRAAFGVNITAGNTFNLAGSGACTSSVINTNTALNGNLFNKPMDLVIQKSGSALAGIYVADFHGHRVNYINNEASPVIIGSQTINPQSSNNILGNGTSVPANPPSGINTPIQFPIGLYLSGSTLYGAGRGSFSIRSLNTSSGATSIYLGGTGRASYSGNAPIDSKLVTLNSPLSLLYKPATNQLFFSDNLNYMIRSVNLSTGRVEDFIGTGSNADENLQNTVTTATRIRSPRAMAMYNDFFIYADGGNNNCFVRAYNPLSNDQLVFSTLVNQNRTNSIAGYYNWCTGSFAGTSSRNTTDPSAIIGNPYGIGVDTSANTMYVSSYSSNCILKVTDGGTIQPVIGSCGTAAGSAIYDGDYADPSLQLNGPTEIVMDPEYPGNFFFIDWALSNSAHIKYVNLTASGGVSLFGVNVPINGVRTVMARSGSPGYIRSMAINSNGELICYTSGNTGSGQGNNTITCRDRTTSTSKVFGVPGFGAIQPQTDQEGMLIDSTTSTASFAAPSGLAFDDNDNLYVSELGSHVIRMIKKW